MVELEGCGVLKLGPSDHVATGGEGSVYRPSPDTIVKIYLDHQKMQKDGMPQKLKLLSSIKHPFIVAPKGLVYQNHDPIGYYMNFEPGEPMARIFTTAYRQREGFDDKDAIFLVDGMHDVIREAHAHKAVLVDANEFNWLVAKKASKVEPRIIDVDSWAIDHWKASVIMPSIRDWHTHGFNDESDWFSFAVVSFQIFTGIHPYKGSLSGYKPNEMERRMKENKSVFAPGVQLNSAVRSFSSIPVPLLEWYEAVFQNQVRTMPPKASDKSNKTPRFTVTKRVVVTSSGLLMLEVIYDGVNDTPSEVYPCGVIRLNSGRLINLENGKTFAKSANLPCEIISTEWGFLLAELQSDGSIVASLLDKNGSTTTSLSTVLKGRNLLRYQNRLFIVSQQGLTELSVKNLGKPILVTLNTWQVMLNSTKWFDGVGIQDSLGTTYFVAPFDQNSCQYVHVPELDRKKVVSAFVGTRYITVVALDTKSGSYQQYEFIFDKTYTSYQVKVKDVATPELNMALLPKGVCASITDDGELLIDVPLNGQQKLISDSRIETSYMLSNWLDRVVAIKDSKVWTVSMK
jgi:hypothetical protein